MRIPFILLSMIMSALADGTEVEDTRESCGPALIKKTIYVEEDVDLTCLQGRPGKSGPKGEKGDVGHTGEKGEMGQTGERGPCSCGETDGRFNEMSSTIQTMKTTIQALQQKVNSLECKGGLIYENTCVFAKFGWFNYDAAQAYCQSKGGYLAYIDSEEKYTVVDNFLRNKAQQTFGNYKFRDFWWGATFKQNSNLVVLNNGERPQWLKWQPPHPMHEPQRTAMIMAVVPNSSSRSNGVFAADPMHRTDALCQKDI